MKGFCRCGSLSLDYRVEGIKAKFHTGIQPTATSKFGQLSHLGGSDLINEGAESLKTLADKIDTTRMKKPSFLMVLTGIGQYAYKRPEDGVLVVPIGCLRP